MIRAATLTDIPQIEALGMRLKLKTPYATFPYHRERALKQLRTCVSSRTACAYVSDDEGTLDGVLLGVCEPLWFSQALIASDLMFYSERPLVGYVLLKRFITWAWTVPSVRQILMGQSSGIAVDELGEIYRRLNFERVGGFYELGRFD